MQLADITNEGSDKVFWQSAIYYLLVKPQVIAKNYKPHPRAKIIERTTTTVQYKNGIAYEVSTVTPYYCPTVRFSVEENFAAFASGRQVAIEQKVFVEAKGIYVPYKLFYELYGNKIPNSLAKPTERTVLHTTRIDILQRLLDRVLTALPADIAPYVNGEESRVVLPPPQAINWKHKSDRIVANLVRIRVQITIQNPKNASVVTAILRNFLEKLYYELEQYCEERKA